MALSYPDLPADLLDGRPVIGICNTWSELTPCNAHFRRIAEHVRYGVLEAGGFPLEFPVSSLGEVTMRPTAMLYRNLAAMDVEEAIRGNPVDAVVLLVGCDKTTPALLMGAASCDVPAIVVTGGPLLNGKLNGKNIGSGTAVWQLHEQVKAGEISLHDFMAAEAGQVFKRGPAASAPAPAEDSGGGLMGSLKDVLFGTTGPRGGRHPGLAETAAKSAVRSIGSAVGREIIRGVLGSILGGSNSRRR